MCHNGPLLKRPFYLFSASVLFARELPVVMMIIKMVLWGRIIHPRAMFEDDQ